MLTQDYLEDLGFDDGEKQDILADPGKLEIARFAFWHNACTEGAVYALHNCNDMDHVWRSCDPGTLVWLATRIGVLEYDAIYAACREGLTALANRIPHADWGLRMLTSLALKSLACRESGEIRPQHVCDQASSLRSRLLDNTAQSREGILKDTLVRNLFFFAKYGLDLNYVVYACDALEAADQLYDLEPEESLRAVLCRGLRELGAPNLAAPPIEEEEEAHAD